MAKKSKLVTVLFSVPFLCTFPLVHILC